MVIIQYPLFILFRKVVICKVKRPFLLLSHHLDSVFSCCSWTAAVDKPTKECSETSIKWISHIKNLIFFISPRKSPQKINQTATCQFFYWPNGLLTALSRTDYTITEVTLRSYWVRKLWSFPINFLWIKRQNMKKKLISPSFSCFTYNPFTIINSRFTYNQSFPFH